MPPRKGHMIETRPITEKQFAIAVPLVMRQQRLEAELLGIRQGVSALVQSFWGDPSATGLTLDIEGRVITKELTPDQVATRIQEASRASQSNGSEGVQTTPEGHGATNEVDDGADRSNVGVR